MCNSINASFESVNFNKHKRFFVTPKKKQLFLARFCKDCLILPYLVLYGVRRT